MPASVTASPGKATITVTNPGGPTSRSRPLTIVHTTLQMTAATLSRDSNTGNITATVTIKNIGYLAASNVKLANSALNRTATTTTLPVSLGTLAAGASVTTSLTYPGSAGTAGTVVPLTVAGKFTGGAFSGSLKVTLP